MKSRLLLKEKIAHGTALIPIEIISLKYEASIENFFYLHWHYEFEFIYVIEGAIIYTIEDKEYLVMAGEGLFVNSDQLHAAKSYKGMSCKLCVVLFHPNLFDYNKGDSTYLKFVYPILNGEKEFEKFLTYEKKWQKSVMELINELYSLRNENISDNELLIKSKLFEIWHLCYINSISLNSTGKKSKKYKIKRLQPVLDYIHENYKEEISLNTLAKIIPMSESQFCHRFKEAMNMSPIAYLIRYRILQSCKLLTETDWKISYISGSVGFNNISYYNREFIKAIGCTPSKYRLDV